MRLEARVLEGNHTSTVLVPLATVLEFKRVHDRSLNDAIGEADFVDWEPWVAWHAHAHRKSEKRSFDDWCDAVEWVGIYQADDALDPSGGKVTPAPATLPESPSTPDVPGPSSSGSTKSSSRRSGAK